MEKKIFIFLLFIILFEYAFPKCHVENAKTRKECFNITLEENEKTEKKAYPSDVLYTPDACCYAWTNYYSKDDIYHRFKNNYTYCQPYEKAKINIIINAIKAYYENIDEIRDFDMFIDCGDNDEDNTDDKDKTDDKDYTDDKDSTDYKDNTDDKGQGTDEKNNQNYGKNNKNIVMLLFYVLILLI